MYRFDVIVHAQNKFVFILQISMSVWTVPVRIKGCVLILKEITTVIVLILDTMVVTVRQVCSATNCWFIEICHQICPIYNT